MGIAVGMATNIPPHNLTELVDGIVHLIDNPDCEIKELTQFVKGPDFPTGGTIYNQTDISQAYLTGRGAIVCARKSGNSREQKRAIPNYHHGNHLRVEQSRDHHEDRGVGEGGKLEGIRDLRDESDKDGVRIVVELKKDAFPKKFSTSSIRYGSAEKLFT